MFDVPFTKNNTLFRKCNAFCIRYVNPLEEQYSLDQNSMLLYTAEVGKYTSLSKNFFIFSNNFNVSANVFEQEQVLSF